MEPDVVPLTIAPNIGVHNSFRRLCDPIPVILDFEDLEFLISKRQAPVRSARVPFKSYNSKAFLVSRGQQTGRKSPV